MDLVTYGAAIKRAREIIEEYAAAGIQVATEDILGGIKVGENLSITPEGVQSVVTANRSEQDNTKPITSAAVYTEIGNINA